MDQADIVEHDDARNSYEFDLKRATFLLLPRTDVLAYIDENTGDLWIRASDAARQIDSEIRINAEDVVAFIDGLCDLVGIPRAAKPRTANAERQRQYRERKRNARNAPSVTRDVTRDAYGDARYAHRVLVGAKP